MSHYYFYFRQKSKELIMYTHVYIGEDFAACVFTWAKYGSEKNQNAWTEFDAHFGVPSGNYLHLGSSQNVLVYDPLEDTYVLKFSGYISELPASIASLGMLPRRVEYVRLNSTPTKAKAGSYKHLTFRATVESVVVTVKRHGLPTSVQVAQNITVSDVDFERLRELDTKLTTGELEEFRIHRFE